MILFIWPYGTTYTAALVKGVEVCLFFKSLFLEGNIPQYSTEL